MGKNKKYILLIGLVYCIISFACQIAPENLIKSESTEEFDQFRAYQDLAYQVSLGPRTIGSAAHSSVVDWIYSELEKNKWDVQLQPGRWEGNDITNVVGKRGEGSPWIILGAHFDSRFFADKDKNQKKRDLPVLGANDGASGVAVLLELARVIPSDLNKQIWLVFFDAEDNGNITGWEWSIGSSIFVDHLDVNPDAVLVIDMIGDSDLNIFKEKNSDPDLTDQIWEIASNLKYSQFINEYNHRVIDDHIPFLQKDIPAMLIIDLDYPYWHTSEDNLEKVSADSLAVVGNVVLSWLKQER
jgi:glutaminyl-peptide cyclotransferase